MARVWVSLQRALLGLFVFVLPLIFATQNTNFGQTKLGFALATISLMLLVWALELAWGAGRFERTGLWWPALGLLAVLAASLARSQNFALSAEAWGMTAYFFLLFLFVANHVRARADVYVVLGGLALSAGLMAGYGLLQYYGQTAGLAGARVPGEAMLSTLGNKNFLGGMLVLGVVPGLTLLLLMRRAWLRLVLLACHGVGLVALLAIQSSGVWLALAASLAAWGVGGMAYRLLGPLVRHDRWLIAWLLVGGVAYWMFSEFAPWSAFSQALTAPRTVALVGRWQAGGTWTVALYDRQLGRLKLNAWRTLSAPAPLQGGWPVAGDWDGDGRTDWAVYQQGAFHWDVNLDGQPDVVVPFGDSGIPVVGDWDGDGVVDSGVYDPQQGVFELATGASAAPRVAPEPGDWPVAGDWNGDGRQSVGLFRPALGVWWLDGDGVLETQRPLPEASGDDGPLVVSDGGRTALGGIDLASGEVWWDEDGDGRVQRRAPWTADDPLAPWLAWLKPSFVIRLEDWHIGAAMLRDHPWLGVGLANYGLRFFPYKARLLETPLGQQLEAIEAHPEVGYIPRAAHAHNEYIELGAEAGLLGLLGLGWVLFAVFDRGGRLLSKQHGQAPEAKWVALGVLTALLGVLVEAEVGFPFHLPASGGAVAVLLGVLFSSRLDGGAGARVRRRWLGALAGVGLALMGLGLAGQNFWADLQVQRGISLWTMGLEHLGAYQIEQSLALDAAPSDALQWLGAFYARYKQPELRQKCVDYNARALKGFPSEQAYWLLGKCQFESRHWDEAIAAFSTLAGVDPEPVYAARLRGLLGDVWEALLGSWTAASADPALAWTQEKVLSWMDAVANIAWSANWVRREEIDYARAMARVDSGLGGGTSEALALLNAWVRARPGHALAHLALGELLSDTGRAVHIQTSLEMLARQRQLLAQRAADGDPAARDALQRLEAWQAAAIEGCAKEACPPL